MHTSRYPFGWIARRETVDQGMKCGRACAENNRWRSYTRVAPGYQAAGAKCWFKSFTPDPVATAGVRSGIVRPQ